jgi:prevent-host-death family protein
MKTISAADANRHFSTLLRDVSCGERITVTSRGKPVATITAATPTEDRERAAARRALLSRLRATPVTGARNWTRDELYE